MHFSNKTFKSCLSTNNSKQIEYEGLELEGTLCGHEKIDYPPTRITSHLKSPRIAELKLKTESSYGGNICK